jgi:ribosomal protein L20A (L18A)
LSEKEYICLSKITIKREKNQIYLSFSEREYIRRSQITIKRVQKANKTELVPSNQGLKISMIK